MASNSATARLVFLQASAIAANARYLAGLQRLFQFGHDFYFKLNRRQVKPTPGTVQGHHSDGRVTFQLYTTNRRGQRTVRRVHWKNIL